MDLEDGIIKTLLSIGFTVVETHGGMYLKNDFVYYTSYKFTLFKKTTPLTSHVKTNENEFMKELECLFKEDFRKLKIKKLLEI